MGDSFFPKGSEKAIFPKRSVSYEESLKGEKEISDVDKTCRIWTFTQKEDFDSDDWERKRTVIKKLGTDLKLSGRTIQFTPVKYLVPIAEKYPELKSQFEFARTDSEQMKKGLKEGLISQWYTG